MSAALGDSSLKDGSLNEEFAALQPGALPAGQHAANPGLGRDGGLVPWLLTRLHG